MLSWQTVMYVNVNAVFAGYANKCSLSQALNVATRRHNLIWTLFMVLYLLVGVVCLYS